MTPSTVALECAWIGGMAREGIAAAELERLYRSHYGLVRRLVVRLGVASASVEDVTHDVFLAISSAKERRDEATSERGWVAGIARNVVLRHRRDLFRHLRRRFAVEQAHVEDDGARGAARSDAARELHALLEGLSEEQRVVFVLMELEEWTAPEVADALQIKLPTVYSRHRAARLALAEALARRRARERSVP